MFTSDTTAKLGASLRGLAFTMPGKDSSMPASGEFTSSSLGIVGPSVDVGVNAKADDESASIQVAPAVRRGIAVVQVLRPEELCLGLIGNTGTKFCIQPAYECNKASHSLPVNKFTAESSGLYISDKKTGCFSEPYLKGRELDDEVVTQLLDLDVEFNKLRKEFVLVGSQDGSQDWDINLYARKNLDKVLSFKTPSKELSKSGGLIASNLTETVDSLIALGAIKELNTPVKKEGEESTPVSLNRLTVQVDTLQKTIPTMAGVIDAVESSLNQKTNLLYGSLQQLKQLEGNLGSYPKILENEGIEPTLWAAITNIVTGSKVSREKLEKDNLLLQTNVKTLERDSASYTTIVDLNNFKNELVSILQSWKITIEDLQSRVSKVEIKANKLYTSKSGEMSSTRLTGGNTSTLLNTLGIAQSSSTNSVNHGLVSSNQIGSSAMTSNADVVGLQDRIEKIEKQQSEHGREGLNGSVRFSGITLTGKDDLGAWLDKHSDNAGGVPPYGVFADPQLLLHWVWITLSGVETSSARDMKDRLSISMTQDKTYAVDSCQHYVPLVFTGKKSSLLNTGGMEKSRLGTIPTFDSWDDASGETGLK
jgi:hypothetical protein